MLANAVNDLEARITKLEGSQEQTDQAVEEVQADVETVKEVVDTEEFALIRDNAKSIVSNFNKLDKKSLNCLSAILAINPSVKNLSIWSK